ncbi:MarR family winged helix-turn-helix transcriptional regulator [Gordonia sp. (in: high G+C Gram-positive bacteria)]|uniref:MarR family winged helix-turn-helix transcriptional regulator n=1 Tax=Gordonia sp. (in: high G+C Gram-positive bacteria) TaxID=84139 RepID=UPI003C70B979
MTQWLDDRSMSAWMAYVWLRIRVEGEIAFDLERHGLSAPDYDVLTTLSAQRDDSMRARDLAKSLTWHKARLSRHLARMDKRGLVTRSPAPEDARGIVVALSPHGRERLEAAAPDHAALIQRMFADQLTEAEIDALVSLSSKVVAAADREAEARTVT